MQRKRFKNVCLSVVIALSFSIIFSSCKSQVTEVNSESTGQTGRLELVSQGVTYQLIEHWVFAFTNGLCADGKWFDKLAVEMDPTLKADLEMAAEIPYADDFVFYRVGSDGSEELDKLSLNIYDGNLELISEGIGRMVIPSETGLYYIAVFTSWGDKDNNSGYQYIFKTRR